MRVLDVDNNYSPTGGGVRVYHDEKARWFGEHGGAPYALLVPSDRSSRVVEGNIVRYHVPALRLGGSGYRFVVRERHVRAVIADFGPDLIEIGSPYVMPRLVRRATRALGHRPATVGFYHSDVPDTLIRPLGARLGTGWADRSAAAATRWIASTYGAMTATFGASRFVLDKLHAAGVRRLFHTPLGVDPTVFSPARRCEAWREAAGVGAGQSLVLYLARIAPEKGIRRVFAAYPLFRDPARVRLVVIGHGPLEHELAAFRERYPEVEVRGFVSDRAEVARAYASADVFLSLGAVETFSLSTSEALASGTPTVAPSVGGAGEQVAAVTPELLFEPSSAESLAAAVRTAVLAGAEQRRRALSACRSWSDVFAHERRCYATIMEAHRSGALEQLEPNGRWWPADTPPETDRRVPQ